MRWLIWYIRSLFCSHEFEREQMMAKTTTEIRTIQGFRVSATCKKCGWHRSYWKY